MYRFSGPRASGSSYQPLLSVTVAALTLPSRNLCSTSSPTSPVSHVSYANGSAVERAGRDVAVAHPVAGERRAGGERRSVRAVLLDRVGLGDGGPVSGDAVVEVDEPRHPAEPPEHADVVQVDGLVGADGDGVAGQDVVLRLVPDRQQVGAGRHVVELEGAVGAPLHHGHDVVGGRDVIEGDDRPVDRLVGLGDRGLEGRRHHEVHRPTHDGPVVGGRRQVVLLGAHEAEPVGGHDRRLDPELAGRAATVGALLQPGVDRVGALERRRLHPVSAVGRHDRHLVLAERQARDVQLPVLVGDAVVADVLAQRRAADVDHDLADRVADDDVEPGERTFWPQGGIRGRVWIGAERGLRLAVRGSDVLEHQHPQIRGRQALAGGGGTLLRIRDTVLRVWASASSSTVTVAGTTGSGPGKVEVLAPQLVAGGPHADQVAASVGHGEGGVVLVAGAHVRALRRHVVQRRVPVRVGVVSLGRVVEVDEVRELGDRRAGLDVDGRHGHGHGIAAARVVGGVDDARIGRGQAVGFDGVAVGRRWRRRRGRNLRRRLAASGWQRAHCHGQRGDDAEHDRDAEPTRGSPACRSARSPEPSPPRVTSHLRPSWAPGGLLTTEQLRRRCSAECGTAVSRHPQSVVNEGSTAAPRLSVL